MFKHIYVARLSTHYSVKFESVVPDNERDEKLEACNRRAIGEDEAIQIEADRGWFSWGF